SGLGNGCVLGRGCSDAFHFQVDQHDLASRRLRIRSGAPVAAILILKLPSAPYGASAWSPFLDPLTSRQSFVEKLERVGRRAVTHHLPFHLPIVGGAFGAEQFGLRALRRGQ